MQEDDPRSSATLLRNLGDERLLVTDPVVAKTSRRPPEGARCEACGSGMISLVPAFSTGSGSAFRAFADDVICQRCGHIGLFVIE